MNFQEFQDKFLEWTEEEIEAEVKADVQAQVEANDSETE